LTWDLGLGTWDLLVRQDIIMRRCFFIVFLVALFVQAAPILRVFPEEVRLGELDTSGGKKVFPVEFQVSNTGDADLLLSKPRSSCGCTKAELEKMQLAPGESTKLSARIDISGRYGAQKFYIYLSSNAEEPSKRLSIEAFVPDSRTGWQIAAPVVQIYGTQEASIHLKLFDRKDDVQITVIDLPEDFELLSELPMTFPAGGNLKISLRYLKDEISENQSLPFTVYSNYKGQLEKKGRLNLRKAAARKETKRFNAAKTADAAEKAAGNTEKMLPRLNPLGIEAKTLTHLILSMGEISDIRLLDVRSTEDFEKGKVPKSQSYPAEKWRDKASWDESAILVIIAESDEKAEEAAVIISQQPCRNILFLKGGYEAWKGR
jgi:rhodanese-related sulfurtransferase